MVKLTALLSAAASVVFLMVAHVQAHGDGDHKKVASLPKVMLTFKKNDGGANQELEIPRDTCYFISYLKWRTYASVQIDSPRINCVIYQDEECKLQ
ncbi:hypothetical protein BG000_006172, partial [Podila horticola]